MLESLPVIMGVASSLVGLSKGATEVAKDIKELVDKPDVDATATKQLVSDLLDRLIRLQTEQAAMHGALADFQKELRRVERFQAEASRYTLVRTELNALVYKLNEADAQGQPSHCICATCYEDQVKSILQPVGHNTFGCGRCGGKFLMPDGRNDRFGSISTGYDVLNPYR